MAGNNSRTVTLTLNAQTQGAESVNALAAEIRKLGTTAGGTSPEFEQMARRLEEATTAEGQQAKTARDAAIGLQAAKQSALEARAAVSSYTAAIGGTKAATAEQTAQLAKLNQAVRDTKAGYDSARAAVAATAPEFSRLKAATADAVAEAERLKAAMVKTADSAQEAGKKTEGAFSGMARSIRGLVAPLAAAFGVDQFLKANTGAESLRRTLELMTGSATAAAKEIEYLKSASNRLGIDVQEAGRAYIGLTAAAKGTTMEGAQTRAIFEAVAGAMSKLGKSSAETEGALQAVSQMMSKGVVSMEEMRQQLGERLPGAMQATADAVGVTVDELVQMIGTGQVLASDLLPKMTEGLQKLYGTDTQVDGLTSSWARLKNAITETMEFLGDSGVVTFLVAALTQLGFAVRGLTGAFDLLGKIIGITFGAIASFDWKHPIDSVNRWKEAVSQAGDDIQKKLDAARGAADKTAVAQAKLADSGQQASKSADSQAVSWLAVVNAYSKVTTAAEQSTKLAEKNAAAKEAEGKAALDLAQAFGTETEKRETALNVAKANTAALQAVAAARRIESETAASNVAALSEAAKAEEKVSEAKLKAIQAAQDSATAKQSEADQAAAAALASQQHAAQLATEAAAITDNSGRVTELKTAYEATAATLENVKLSREMGIATLADEQAAAIAAGEAAYLYRDALNDQTKAVEQNATAKQSQFKVDQAGISLAIQQQQTIYQVARARGDEYAASAALLEIKRLEIKLAELTAQAKRAEAEAAMLTVAAKRAELQASGQLTAAKEAELKAQEAAAKVKKVEADISAELAKRARDLAAVTNTAAGASRNAVGSHEVLIASLQGVAEAAGQAVAAMSDLDKYEANKYSDPKSSGSFLDGGHQADKSVDVAALMYKKGATIEEVRAAQKYYGELYQRNSATMLTGNLGNASNATAMTNMASNQAIEQALELARSELQTGKAVDLGTSVSDLQAQALAKIGYHSGVDGVQVQTAAIKNAGNEAKAQPVHITIGGKTQAVNMATTRDAAALTGILRQLEADSGRAY
ncbi:tape measure protein [Dechloromonas sp. TW-R-39-2]|uniref:tape measure protein n=1 Tax=Dechloromonas sp. TW-R-39-2 TaxID=2654218 RepID=UPI00193D286F|nr:tape measure protein [Dechloromonas sp. TW-R-39-2]QRM19706.1 tape measure protein [Dechloromonas sp. TW-R-39-2]